MQTTIYTHKTKNLQLKVEPNGNVMMANGNAFRESHASLKLTLSYLSLKIKDFK